MLIATPFVKASDIQNDSRPSDENRKYDSSLSSPKKCSDEPKNEQSPPELETLKEQHLKLMLGDACWVSCPGMLEMLLHGHACSLHVRPAAVADKY